MSTLNQFAVEDLGHEMWLADPGTEREFHRWLWRAYLRGMNDERKRAGEIRVEMWGGEAGTASEPGAPGFVGIELPDGTYIAVDANCPGCGHPERRARFDEHGAVFSCQQCPYVSRGRDA